MLLKSK